MGVSATSGGKYISVLKHNFEIHGHEYFNVMLLYDFTPIYISEQNIKVLAVHVFGSYFQLQIYNY